MLELPLIANPNQEFYCVLDGQECTIQLRQIGDDFYFSLWLDDTAIVQNVICLPQILSRLCDEIYFIPILQHQ